MKDIVNSTLAREVELDRPSKTISERIFRFCLFYVVFGGLILGVMRLFLDRNTIESDGGAIGGFFGILYGICFIYMLNFMAAKFVKSRFIKITWFSLMGLVTLLITQAVINKK